MYPDSREAARGRLREAVWRSSGGRASLAGLADAEPVERLGGAESLAEFAEACQRRRAGRFPTTGRFLDDGWLRFDTSLPIPRERRSNPRTPANPVENGPDGGIPHQQEH
ncbi:MAG: hypothetical protein IH921_03760 [Gemmatimonadetes bacterium]|nr:hypothetical protein [Gemmatimonadota bacterium]